MKPGQVQQLCDGEELVFTGVSSPLEGDMDSRETMLDRRAIALAGEPGVLLSRRPKASSPEGASDS